MSAICSDVMVLVCNGAFKVSLTLYAPIFVFDAVYVCRNLCRYEKIWRKVRGYECI